MGTYRLLLAVAVMLSHVEVFVRERNQGVTAVVSFLLLSGFVMTALIRRHYGSPDRIGGFYADRALRLFPQFLFYLLLTLALIAIAQPKSHYLTNLSWSAALLNASMIALAGQQWWLEHAQLMPQAWSLGLELTFYLAIPLVLWYRLERIAFLASLAIFALAFVGTIDTDLFGYRLLPGTLFIFLLGSLLHGERTEEKTLLVAFAYLASLVMLGLWYVNYDLRLAHSYEVLVGILVGFPIVAVLTRVSLGSIDATLGNISYGVFLNHFFLIWLFQSLGIEVHSLSALVLLAVSSFLLAWATFHWVERPVLALRQKLRAKSAKAPFLPESLTAQTAVRP